MMKAEKLIDLLREKKLKLVTAESCTGGLLGASITAIPGSSDVYDRGFITYSNQSKTDLVNVPAEVIEKHGAVSEEVARQMAIGALENTRSDISVSCTGIAGPAGGTAEKPVGLVYIGVCYNGKTRVVKNQISGGRYDIQIETVARALDLIAKTIA